MLKTHHFLIGLLYLRMIYVLEPFLVLLCLTFCSLENSGKPIKTRKEGLGDPSGERTLLTRSWQRLRVT